MSKPIIIYSHGFGVKQDNRGLFTDIAEQLPEFEHVMFNYNSFDATKNTMTATPLDEQARKLAQKIKEIKLINPSTPLNLICHSQGCIVASLAKAEGFEQIIFLAPPTSLSGASSKVKEMLKRAGTTRFEDGSVSYPRRDGSTTIVGADYLRSREGLNPIEEYNKLSSKNPVFVVRATEDEVIGYTDLSNLSKSVEVTDVRANHDFRGESREEVIKIIKGVLLR